MDAIVEWGRGLAVNGRWVLHLDHWLIARVTACYAPGEYRDAQGQLLDDVVLGLDGGHTVVVTERSKFLVLEQGDVVFVKALQEVLNTFLVEAGKMGSRMGVKSGVGVKLLRGVLQRQATALGAITTTENDNG